MRRKRTNRVECNPIVNLFQHVGIGFDGGFDAVDRFFHSALQLAAAGIFVSATIEKPRSHLVAREIAHTAKAQFHDARVLRIFVDEYAQPCAQHGQGNVDDALRVAVLDFETAPLVVRECDDGCVSLVQDAHVHIEQITLQP